MHPKNIYKSPPDFSKLASKYPEFLKISTVDLNGTVKIDFRDVNSLRVLTKCLLHSDFGLTVNIPENKLVPTVPLRLNYLLWIEDLLTAAGIKDDIKGIDIGTGACCIYPLLAVKHFKWKMLATEIDEISYNSAMGNIKQNDLDNFITLKKWSEDSFLLLDCFDKNRSESFDFCMCNPPFYSSTNDLYTARSPSRDPPRNAFTGSVEEIITPGGEEAFINGLIEESLTLKDSVKIYTTMLGHKKSLKTLMRALKDNNITQIAHTTFEQGKTTRWGLAWSFLESTNLLQKEQRKEEKAGKPICFIIPPIECLDYTVNAITEKILNILDTLEIKRTIPERTDTVCTMQINAFKNTWSHQRRKRREMKHGGSSEEAPSKKIKLENRSEEMSKTNGESSSVPKEASDYLQAALCIRKLDDHILLEMAYMKGSCGKDGVNQIIQYIKNNWK